MLDRNKIIKGTFITLLRLLYIYNWHVRLGYYIEPQNINQSIQEIRNKLHADNVNKNADSNNIFIFIVCLPHSILRKLCYIF